MQLTVPLAGPAGEPVDLWRTLMSHGVADLPPMRVDEAERTLTATLPLRGAKPRTVVIRSNKKGAGLDVLGPRLGARGQEQLLEVVRRVLNLDENLSGFYEVAAADPELAWAADGAGRMLRSPSMFEEVIKTICTTNCAWSATVRMTTALVEHLGEPSTGNHGRAFPQPAAMAEAGNAFYRDVVRAGYRGPYLRTIAAAVAAGELDLDRLLDPELADAEVAERLLALPGVGPYAAAHVMMLLGRYSSLVLDSWTRPKYARLVGKKKVADTTIIRRFRHYGPYAGLAFWLFLTRDWVPDPVVNIP
ncbi:MAG: Fe-S cluster assembly protein HesB [Actinobacteria bacterium]|nr:Fe-S cluster assembly protein HesB [Actinomycetota bacterium]